MSLGAATTDPDPWGGNDQGPPDLDEALKKLQQRLSGLFGGRGGGGSGGGNASGRIGALLGVIAAGAITVWALMGFYQLDEQERAIVLRFGEYAGTPAGTAVESAPHR